MNGLGLFARTRRWPLCLALIALTGILIVACGPLSYSLNPTGGYRVAAASQVPLLAALAIQGTLTPALPRQERQSARALWPWRLLHIVVLTIVGAAVAGTAALFIQPPEGALLNASNTLGPTALIRDLLAFTGAALTFTAIVEPALGWILPLAWAILPAVALSDPNADPTGLLRLATQPDTAPLPLVVASAIWVLGTTLAATDKQLLRR